MSQSASRHRQRIVKILRLIGFSVLAFVLVIEVFGAVQGYQEVDTILYPERQVFCCDTPADAGLAYEELALQTADALTLAGWYLPADDRTESATPPIAPNGDCALILSHGASGNRVSMWDVGLALREQGCGILFLEMRAHGSSEGDVFTQGWLDIQAAADWLQSRGIQHIGAYGFSLGAVMSIQAAALSTTIDAVVADGAGPAVIADMPLPTTLSGWLYGLYDLVYWTQLEARSAAHGGFAAMPMTEAIARMAPRPLLLIAAGAEPSQFEVNVNQALYTSADPTHTALWIIEDVGHGGGWSAHREAYLQRLTDFFALAFS